MASKICPSCGAKNPSTAYSCSNCAASLIDIPSASFPSSTATASGYSSLPSSVTPSQSAPSTSPSPKNERQMTTRAVETYPTGEQPIVVFRQSPWTSVANALVSSVFLLIFGFAVGIASIGLLASISYIVVIVAIPGVIGYLLRPKYEFYDTHMVRVARGGGQQVPYSEIQSVDQRRGGIVLSLKQSEEQGRMFRIRPIVIPGNPKLSTGSDLLTWLKGKITPAPAKEPNNTETNNSNLQL